MKVSLITPSSKSYESIREITESNKIEYCKSYGINFIPLQYLDPTDKGYSRMQFMRDHIESCEWLINMDSDAIFVNFTTDIKEFFLTQQTSSPHGIVWGSIRALCF